jgi:hypothetical protein
MKKLSILAVAALAFSFASCKKDYVCTCTTTNSLGGTPDTDVTTFKGVSKGTAKKLCVDKTTYDTDAAASINTTDCTLSK